MATRGCKGTVRFGSPSNAVAGIQSVNINKTAARIDISAMDGSCAKAYDSGAVETILSFTMNWVKADAGQEEIAIGLPLDFEVFPDGETTGDDIWSGQGNVQNHSRSAEVNGVWQQSVEVTVNGDITEATVP